MIRDVTWIEVEEEDREAFAAGLVRALALCEKANAGLRIRSAKCAGWFIGMLHDSELKIPLSSLRHLNLLNCGIGEEGALALAQANHLQQLRSLNLGFSRIGTVGAKAIAAAEHFELLTHLYLTGNQIENLGLKALVNAPQLCSLIELDLGLNGIDISGVRSLAQASHLTDLQLLKLDLNRICDAGAEILVKADHFCNLHSLDLSDNRLHAEGAVAIVEAKYLNQLKYLDLSGNKIGNSGVQALARGYHLSHLSSLSLRRNRISDEGVLGLSCSTYLSDLVELDLAENNLSHVGISALTKASWIGRLQKLNLNRNNIGDLGFKAISVSAFAHNLVSLKVSKNKISDEGVLYIASACHMQQLTELELSHNKIGSYGVRALSAANHLKNLQRLNLQGNEIGDSGLQALAAAVHMDKIKFLNLSSNYIGDKGVVALAQAAHFGCLQELMLDNNTIGEVGVRALAESGWFAGITQLNLSSNQVGDKGACSLAKSLYFTRLTELNLFSNQIGDVGALGLAEAEGLTSLVKLDLGLNKITDYGAKALALSSRLAKLKSLSLIENQLTLRSRFQNDLDQLREYLKLDTVETTRPLLRARCMLIGAPHAGKTITFEALTGAPYLGLHPRARTQGFQRSCALTFNGIKRRDGDIVNLTLDLWDLGGHTLQHMVHRLFFRANSLYLLVIDEATVNNPSVIDYWLHPIANMAGNESAASLIPVLNPHGQLSLQFEEFEPYFQHYSNSLQIYAPVNVRFMWHEADVSALRNAIKLHLTDHSIESYWQVHDEIAVVVNTWNDNYLHEDEFERRLYSDPIVKGILSRFKERLAGGERINWDSFYQSVKDFLDDAGIVSLVPPYIILNPRWVSDGLYVLMPPEPIRSELEDRHVLPANKLFREKLQSQDLSLGLPGVFTRDDVDAVLSGLDFIAADRKALLEILCNPRLGLMISLASVGIKDTYLMPHYLEQFCANSPGKSDEELEGSLAQEIVALYKQAQVCSVLTANQWPHFLLYQFLVAYWPQAEVFLSDDRPSFYSTQDLSCVNRRRIRMESYDGLMAVDMLLYQDRIWCFGFSQQENDLPAINSLIAEIKSELHLLINNQRGERRLRVDLQASLPCPRCMATIARAAAQGETPCHEYLRKLVPGSGMVNKQMLQEEKDAAALFACGHPNDKHRFSRSEWMGENKVASVVPKAAALTDLDDNHVQGLQALKLIADVKGYSLIGLAPATLAKINRADRSELVAMKRNTAKAITDEWKNLRGDYKDFPKELLKATGRDVLPGNPYQLNAALIEYAEHLVKKATAH